MVTLVDTLGWSFGLPDEPQDPDYMNILAGNRELRLEAEDVYAKDKDNVSVMTFRNFGSYSGKGWLHGTREPTDIHLSFNLPLAGEYLIQAHLRQMGHQFKVGQLIATADASPEFTLVTIGTFQLEAGAQEVLVTLPPNGSIDYISLSAPNLAPITPAGGWQPDKRLNWDTVQTTMLQLFQLAELFPRNPAPIIIEAEQFPQPGVEVVDIQHLGRPSNGKWLRTGPLKTKVRFSIKLPRNGFYDLSVRAMGNPVEIVLADHQGIILAAKRYLDDHLFPSLYLQEGNSNITLSLPPGGGVDRLSFTERQVDTIRASTLLGLTQSDFPSNRDIDILTSLLAAFGIAR